MDTLSWGSLEPYIDGKTPALLAAGGTKQAQIGYEPKYQRLFLRVPLSEEEVLPASPYAELGLEERLVAGQRVLELAVSSPHLHREFHRLTGLLTEELEVSQGTVSHAVGAVVERWRELTQPRNLLSEDEQLGLYGELAFLSALISRHGDAAVLAWTARSKLMPERHDFRVGGVEVEVKTTRASGRKHVVHGLRQLEPSPNHELFVVSFRLEDAGLNGGSSLSDRVRKVRNQVGSSIERLAVFNEKLLSSSYRDEDEAHYRKRLVIADEPMLIPVDEKCPKITRLAVETVLGVDLAVRISNDVSYRVDFEGLGGQLRSCEVPKALEHLEDL